MDKFKIEPLEDKIIVLQEEAESITKGGIIIPDSVKEKPQRGTIIAVGMGKKGEPMTLKAGQHVLYNKYAGTNIVVDEVEYLIMSSKEILAIVNI